MKKTALIASALASAMVLTACGQRTSGRVAINENDIIYTQDSRTGLCFAFTASKDAGWFGLNHETSGLGMAEVECTDEVLALVR